MTGIRLRFNWSHVPYILDFEKWKQLTTGEKSWKKLINTLKIMKQNLNILAPCMCQESLQPLSSVRVDFILRYEWLLMRFLRLSCICGPGPSRPRPSCSRWPGRASTSGLWSRWWGWSGSQTRWQSSQMGRCGGSCENPHLKFPRLPQRWQSNNSLGFS